MKLLILILSLFVLNFNSFAQVSEYGNIEIYTRETSFSSFGYFSGSFPLSGYVGGDRVDFYGVNYSNYYDLAKISSIPILDQLEVRFILKGVFKIGGAVGQKTINIENEIYPNKKIKYYLINVDFFSLSLQPEVTHVFNDGYAITLFTGIDLINIGGSSAILESGEILKHMVSAINPIPLTFRPGAYFDFGRSALGISGQINVLNIFEYRILSRELYPGINGAQTFDAFVRKFEFQIIYTF